MNKYIKPEITTIYISTKATLLGASTGVGSDDNGIGFGGTDYEGGLEPQSTNPSDIWEKEW